MSELVIKTHDFELAKRGLKQFSQKKAEELKIDTVRTDGGFLGFGDHKVTGFELNSRLSTIQQHLIHLNTTNNRSIKEFGQVYSALEALDKDYIQAILISIKATEKTSERIQITQDQIKKIVDDQKRTLEVLKKFKQKLDGYDHLEDVDIIWNNLHKLHDEITVLSNSISSAAAISKVNAQTAEGLKAVLKATENKLNDLSRQLNQQIVKLEAIIAFTSELENIVHLQDIDVMWDSLSNIHNSLANISNQMSSFKDTASKQQSDLESLLSFMEKLSSVEHLIDVDDIWTKSEEHHLRLDDLVKTNEGIKFDVNSNAKNIDELQKHKNHLRQIKHLDDVDSIWETTEAHSVRLKELMQQDENTLELVQENKISIDELIEYKSKLRSITHLNDVDDIWSSSELHSSQLSELEKQSDEIRDIVQTNKENTDAAIASIVKKNDIAVQMLTKKIKYAYLLAGGLLGLAIIELIVILLKVI
ncbi:hypothetical protein MHB77_12710 [Paenibacillus sp. FSL K6-3166]|uniref:hypothetical protein n=1 Tax=unclassified Paenibacillus TaxID=185978 RepID=UPI000BA00852|nr:hypothetical protein [Paenibacillus sp. VTT E-133291]OZQ85402.1 hypothetical protein CA598_20995 [Paenibacillus sp. VTT E-133291]